MGTSARRHPEWQSEWPAGCTDEASRRETEERVHRCDQLIPIFVELLVEKIWSVGRLQNTRIMGRSVCFSFGNTHRDLASEHAAEMHFHDAGSVASGNILHLRDRRYAAGTQQGNPAGQTNYGLAHVDPDQVPDDGPFSLRSIP